MKLFQARIIGGGATFVGVGIARMAFTPLAAVAVHQGLWPTNAPSKIAAFLLIAYAAGATTAPWLLRKLKASRLLQISLFLSSLCLVLEALSPTVGIWLLTRSVLGFFGACLMVSGPILALSLGTPEDRHQTQFWTFSGIGLGACISASLIEFRSELIFMLIPMILLCFGLFTSSLYWAESPEPSLNSPTDFRVSLPKLLIFAYGLDAIAYIPATVYLSDYVSNELGLEVGNELWQLFGVGAIFGPYLATELSKRLGSATALHLAYLSKTLALLILASTEHIELLALGSTLTGACVPAIVLLTAAELRRILGTQLFSWAWSISTSIFACSQAIGALTMAFCFQLLHSYQPLFVAGTLLLMPACFLSFKSLQHQSS
ncbi:MAG: YbfB/YjiJ family MFS transporter [Limnoraphis robusta]|uniref:Uncharacterized protein n=1 Tax=Limnoraphis robusta CS-951 TaxID=1637645 RepID=A0A0F5YLR0_9CYAN|nr:YbfB/YjiJ family MFS transporter [Limnoraphis robusta]KKD39703.1 hypothetical protein WN50_01845 [Limnoraphis robusta CS-951]